MIFIETNHCRSHAHCSTCRSRDARGLEFRAVISQHFETPPIEYTDIPFGFTCPDGLPWDSPPPPVQAVAEPWPFWARMVQKMATSTDAGVGDTIARVIGPLGGDAWKTWYTKITGHSCGCEERQEVLNQLYPYSD